MSTEKPVVSCEPGEHTPTIKCPRCENIYCDRCCPRCPVCNARRPQRISVNPEARSPRAR